MADTNGGSIAASRISIPIAVGVSALLLGVGGTVFYSGGSLHQVEINAANIARLEEDVRKLPAVDSDFRAAHSSLVAQVSGMRLEIDAIRRELRPREFWERESAEIGSLRLQVAELVLVRDRGIQEWNALLQRVASLEAHFNDLAARAQVSANDVREELKFYRDTAARRLEAPPAR